MHLYNMHKHMHVHHSFITHFEDRQNAWNIATPYRLTSASQVVLRIKRKRILKHLLTIERCVRRIMGVLPMQLV